jgi:hypothetical protein
MNTSSHANAGKTVLGPGATPLWTQEPRQSPYGLRGSLPATVCFPRVRIGDKSMTKVQPQP